MRLVVSTYACEQRHSECSRYRFPGTATVNAPDTGPIWSAFRPSDDPVEYRFNIPQQMLASIALEDLGTLAVIGFGDSRLSAAAATIAVTVRQAIERYALVYNFKYGWIYAYEVDGRGRHLIMDDANMPNLLSAPLFGFLRADNPRYLATRRFILSRDDPSFYEGRFASGLGSHHTPTNWVWPLGVIAQGLTALSPLETHAALLTLSQTDGDDGLIHESFDPNDYGRFTRGEFGWGNAMYAELLFRSAASFPGPSLGPRGVALVDPGLPSTPQVVNTLPQNQNLASLIDAFERAVPLQAVRVDSNQEQED